LDINGQLTNVLAETDESGTIATYYVHGLGLTSKVLPDGTTYTYHYDSRGSTVALTDVAQTITDVYAYDSFGKLAGNSGSTQNPFKYVGKYGVVDEGNGIDYIKARYYIPEVGGFIAKDPVTGKDSSSQSLNRYVYALNNPIRLVDITGLSAQDSITRFGLTSPSDEYHIGVLNPSSSMTNAGSTPAVLTKIGDQMKGSVANLSEEAFYSEMKQVLQIYVLPKAQIEKYNPYSYMFDSNFFSHGNELYYFEGKYVYGHELNYYAMGLLFRHYGLSERTMENRIIEWKMVNHPFSKLGIIPRPGDSFIPSSNSFLFAQRGYAEYEVLRQELYCAGGGGGGGGGGSW
jgi:RHS repeat-associated protein